MADALDGHDRLMGGVVAVLLHQRWAFAIRNEKRSQNTNERGELN
jgi:hypothetical protein